MAEEEDVKKRKKEVGVSEEGNRDVPLFSPHTPADLGPMSAKEQLSSSASATSQPK